MAKLTLTDLSNLQNEASVVAAINNNSGATETAMEKTLSRDGTSPNTMAALLDMNSNTIINLPVPATATEPLRKGDIGTLVQAADAATSLLLDVLGSTQGNILYRNATDWTVLAPGTLGQVLSTNGAAANPGWISAPASAIADDSVTFAKIQNIATDSLIGRDTAGTGDPESITLDATLEMTGANVLRRPAISGDITISTNSNVASLASDSVTFAKIQNLTTDSLIGRDTAGTGDPEAITLNATLSMDGANNLQRAALTGDVTASAGSNATTVANDVITFAKMQNIATATLIGRSTAGSGDPELITLTAAGRAILDDAAASDQRTTLGLAIGSNVQAFHDSLSALGADAGEWTIALRNTTGSGVPAYVKISTLTDRTAFGAGDKIMIEESTGELRKIDFSDLPGAGAGLSNAYANITDGTTTAAAVASDTFKIRVGAVGGITAPVQNNDATHGDNVLITLDITGTTAVTAPAVDDEFIVYDLSATANRKLTFSNFMKVIDVLTAETAPAVGDELALFDVSAGTTDKIVLSDLFKVINGLTAETVPDTVDQLVLYDDSAGTADKVTLNNLFTVVNTFTAESAPAVGDLLPLFDVSAATADKITLEDTFKVVNGFTEDSAPASTTDYLPSYDTSAAAIKKVLHSRIGVGKQTIWIPAGAMTGRTTNGAASATFETTTNDLMFKFLDFDATTSEGAGFPVRMPKSWNESTVTFQPVWTAASGSGTVIWNLKGVATSDDDPLDATLGTLQSSTDTLLLAVDNHTGPESAAITIAGTPAALDMVYFEVSRDVTDTLAVDARLIGITLFYTTDANIDD